MRASVFYAVALGFTVTIRGMSKQEAVPASQADSHANSRETRLASGGLTAEARSASDEVLRSDVADHCFRLTSR